VVLLPVWLHLQNGTCPKGVNCNMAHNLFGESQQQLQQQQQQ
jgi:hypothetical protein